MKKLVAASFVFASAFLILGCDSTKETFETPPLKEYFPLNVGATLTYRLDSTVPAPFGTALLVKSYQAKDSIESTFIDNEGRTSYRIFRLIRNLSGTQPWRFAATYVATPTANSIEYVDNNLRFVKLVSPLKDGYAFKAHSFIDTKSINSQVSYLDDWEYEYQNVGKPYTVGNKKYENTVTVFQHNETTPDGAFNPNNYQQRNYGVEVYAKGIGLIYKDFLHWTYQVTPPPAKYEDASFGVKLTAMSF